MRDPGSAEVEVRTHGPGIIARYPRPKSALIALLHLAQQQHGYLTDTVMREIADLVGITPAEVKGTASFYEMFRFAPVGRYLINICTSISCHLMGSDDLLLHAQQTLGVRAGETTQDAMFTLAEVECVAACTEAPCLQINYRYCHKVTESAFDRLVSDIRSGQVDEIPEHGTLGRVRQVIPASAGSMIVAPEEAREAPVWLARNPDENAP